MYIYIFFFAWGLVKLEHIIIYRRDSSHGFRLMFWQETERQKILLQPLNREDYLWAKYTDDMLSRKLSQIYSFSLFSRSFIILFYDWSQILKNMSDSKAYGHCSCYKMHYSISLVIPTYTTVFSHVIRIKQKSTLTFMWSTLNLNLKQHKVELRVIFLQVWNVDVFM